MYVFVVYASLPGGSIGETRLELKVFNDREAIFAAAWAFLFGAEPLCPGAFGFLYQGDREVARFPLGMKNTNEDLARAKTPSHSFCIE